MADNEIYVFKNSEYRFRLNCILSIFFICLFGCICGNYVNFFSIAFCLFVLAIYYVTKQFTKNSLYYSTITVDNRNKKLIFKTYTNVKEVYEYENIKKISYDRHMYYHNNRVITNIRIYNKSNQISQIELSDDEFSANFLKKLPKYVNLEHIPTTTSIITKIAKILLFILILIYISCLFF